MGIYIKGFKPQDGLYVIKDGMIRKDKGKGGTVRPYELVEVEEPHGRLIDADALMLTIKDKMDYFKHEGVDACCYFLDSDGEPSAELWCVEDWIDNSKTVIEGSE